jgi:hypothetical protein
MLSFNKLKIGKKGIIAIVCIVIVASGIIIKSKSTTQFNTYSETDLDYVSTDSVGFETVVESFEPDVNYHVDAVGEEYYSSPESFYNSFIDAVSRNDMVFIYDNIATDNNEYLTKEDVEYVLRRSTISHFIGNPINASLSPKFNTQGGVSTIEFNTIEGVYDISKIFKLNLKLSEDNKWQIDPAMLSKDIYYCYVPSGVRFYLNDKEVPDKYKTKTENNLDFYEIPNVAYRDWSTKLVSSSFGEINGEINVVAPEAYSNTNDQNKWVEIPKTLSSDLFTEVTSQVKDIYSKVYSMIDNNSDSTELNQFTCSNRDYTYFEQYYYDAINNYTNTIDSTKLIYNIMILDIYQNPSVESYVFSDDSVVVNVVLSIRWNTGENNIHSNKITSAMKMTKEGDKWLLNEIKSNGWSAVNMSSTSEDVGIW